MTTPELPNENMPIAAVERDTGISKDTLRVWERRYGFPVPERDGNGERSYPPDQVEKLRIVKRLLDQGLRPARVLPQSLEELNGLLDQFRRQTPDEPSHGVRRENLLELVKLQRHEELRGQLHQLMMKQGLQTFVVETIARMNEVVGDAWLRGEIDVPEEHLYTEQVQNVLRQAISTRTATGSGRPRILLTTFPDELHGLGLLMAEAMLVPEGVTCVSLGTQTPVQDIVASAISGRFDVVALSFSAAFPARRAIDGLIKLHAMLPTHISLWAGGAAVRDKQKRLPGIRVIDPIGDITTALMEWRNRRP